MIGLEPINFSTKKTNAITEVTLTNTTALSEKRYKSMNLFSYIPILKNAVRKATRLIYTLPIKIDESLMYTILHLGRSIGLEPMTGCLKGIIEVTLHFTTHIERKVYRV